MLGGHHFKKKIDKRMRRKAARSEARRTANDKNRGKSKAQPQQPQQRQQSSAPYKTKSSSHDPSKISFGLGKTKKKNKSKTQSTLKGPVVTYASGVSRDSGNDKRQVPYRDSSFMSSNSNGGRNSTKTNNSNSNVTDSLSNQQRAMRASSAAQRRSVLKHKTDDDLLSHFREKLQSSTFRLLNEQIYSSPTSLVTQLLSDAETFADYHVGYKQQLAQWPINPNQLIIDCLLGDRRGKFLANKGKKLPGHIPLSWVIADMGCGDAQIAQTLVPKGYTVHSFDLTSTNTLVTVANTASVTLPDQSTDVCVFSLSLMATDYELSLFEAFRILKPNRLLKIIEVRSRLPFPSKFAEMVSGIGFVLEYTDVVGDYFVAFDFVKRDDVQQANKTLRHAPGDVLVPSLYKKR